LPSDDALGALLKRRRNLERRAAGLLSSVHGGASLSPEGVKSPGSAEGEYFRQRLLPGGNLTVILDR
jgi:hypothetical protein